MRRDAYQMLSIVLLLVIVILVGILVYDNYNSNEPIWKSFMDQDTIHVDTARVNR